MRRTITTVSRLAFVGLLAAAGCSSSEGNKSDGSATGGAGSGTGGARTGGSSGATGGASGATGGAATGGASGATGGARTGGAGPGTGGATPGTGGAPAADASTGADVGPAADAGSTGARAVMQFMIPRAGAYPHDPAVDSKGWGWWTDQNNSYIGYWDPATGKTMDFATATPNCGPHGLTPDDQDNIWYTGQACGRIGKVNPTTGMVTDYVVPGGGGPHTPVFHKGAIWFTLQSGGRFGRVNVQSGMVETWPIGPGPYGLWPAPDGSMWVAMFPTNKLVQINPDNPTMLREVTLPRPATRVRRLAVDKMGRVYYGDNANGPLGRFDPSAPMGSQFKEWTRPGGENDAPYGMTIGTDDRVYYFVGGTTVAVFDPASETFDTVRLPIAGSTVRHMATDRTRRRVWMGLNGNGTTVRHMAYIQLP